ncbi:hypothetical protein HYH03_007458 [Edaphochlamys debaryana]|uniref:Uncharacterized protein n=1 Tax=Edaphochlamys debaryana TaxID=47281 RepID=A0A835Y590_9CHLO|nr:hypothetical protein HYH03_007458 [Edaphochlamys debaryana]|eukprot:KAG2494406.1 hypothetical protein HYH03_007458 [Edaphochlamys debaryana]
MAGWLSLSPVTASASRPGVGGLGGRRLLQLRHPGGSAVATGDAGRRLLQDGEETPARTQDRPEDDLTGVYTILPGAVGVDVLQSSDDLSAGLGSTSEQRVFGGASALPGSGDLITPLVLPDTITRGVWGGNGNVGHDIGGSAVATGDAGRRLLQDGEETTATTRDRPEDDLTGAYTILPGAVGVDVLQSSDDLSAGLGSTSEQRVFGGASALPGSGDLITPLVLPDTITRGVWGGNGNVGHDIGGSAVATGDAGRRLLQDGEETPARTQDRPEDDLTGVYTILPGAVGVDVLQSSEELSAGLGSTSEQRVFGGASALPGSGDLITPLVLPDTITRGVWGGNGNVGHDIGGSAVATGTAGR